MTNPIDSLQRLVGRREHAADVLGARLEGQNLDRWTTIGWNRVLRQALERMERMQLMVEAVAAVFDWLGPDAWQHTLAQAVLMTGRRQSNGRPAGRYAISARRSPTAVQLLACALLDLVDQAVSAEEAIPELLAELEVLPHPLLVCLAVALAVEGRRLVSRENLPRLRHRVQRLRLEAIWSES